MKPLTSITIIWAIVFAAVALDIIFVEKNIDITEINELERSIDFEREVEDDAIDILEKRYAKGEITKEEFDDMKKNLE